MFEAICKFISKICKSKELKDVVDEYNDVDNQGDQPSLEDMKKAELHEYMNAHGIEYKNSDSKKVLLEKIYAAN